MFRAIPNFRAIGSVPPRTTVKQADRVALGTRTFRAAKVVESQDYQKPETPTCLQRTVAGKMCVYARFSTGAFVGPIAREP